MVCDQLCHSFTFHYYVSFAKKIQTVFSIHNISVIGGVKRHFTLKLYIVLAELHGKPLLIAKLIETRPQFFMHFMNGSHHIVHKISIFRNIHFKYFLKTTGTI